MKNKKFKKIILILILLITFLIGIGDVNADSNYNEDNSTSISTSEESSDFNKLTTDISNKSDFYQKSNDNYQNLSFKTNTTNNNEVKQKSKETSAYKKFLKDIKKSNGETVYLNENIIIDHSIKISKNIIIDGNNHIIDGNEVTRIFNITGTVTLKNLILKNANAKIGSAIYNSGKLTIDNCQFIENTANSKSGSAIYSKGKLKIFNSKFIGNYAHEDGGAICCKDSALIQNCIFENNIVKSHDKDSRGGAIYCEGNTEIIDCTFKSNSATSNIESIGGAIYLHKGNHYLKNCKFIENTAKNHGGAIFTYSYSNTLKIDACEFINNKALKEDGGAISFCGKNLIITNSKFIGNYAYEDGGAIDSYSIGNYKVKVTIKNSIFKSNTGRKSAGAIYLGKKTKSSISKTTFTNNKAPVAGAIYIEGYSSSIKTCVFNKNSASKTSKKKVYSKKGSKIKHCGGAIYNKCASVKIFQSKFSKNKAKFGAALFNKARMKVYKSIIKKNKATFYGGGLYQDKGKTILIKNIISSNSAKMGGGLLFKSGKGKVQRNIILFNKGRYCPALYSNNRISINYNWWKHTQYNFKKGPRNSSLTNIKAKSWLYLKISAKPQIVNKGKQTTIILNLRNTNTHRKVIISLKIPVTLSARYGKLKTHKSQLSRGLLKTKFKKTSYKTSKVTANVLGVKISFKISHESYSNKKQNTKRYTKTYKRYNTKRYTKTYKRYQNYNYKYRRRY